MSEEDVKKVLSEGNFTTSEIARKLNVSRNTAIKLLEVMRAKGLVNYRQIGQAKLWFWKPTTDEERKKVQEEVYRTIKSAHDEAKEKLAFSAATVKLIEKTLSEIEKEQKRKKR